MAENEDIIDAEFKVTDTRAKAAFLATRPQEITEAGDFKEVISMFLSAGRRTGWGKDLNATEASMLAVAAQQTGLSPLTGEILMLGGSVYVTEVGVLKNADRNEHYDGYDLEPLSKEDAQAWGIPPDEIAFKCTVYRKDRSRPFIGVGHAAKGNVANEKIHKWMSEMAQKRAVERAHSRAFPAGLPLYDEQAMQEPIRTVGVTATVTDIATNYTPETQEAFKTLKWTTARIRIERQKYESDEAFLLAVSTELEALKTSKPRGATSAGDKPDKKAETPAPAPEPAASDTQDEEDAEPPVETGDSQQTLIGETLLISKNQRTALILNLRKLGIGNPKDKDEDKTLRLQWLEMQGLTDEKGEPLKINSFNELTEAQALKLLDSTTSDLKAMGES